MKILHITAHLGGGVGKVLSGVIAQSIGNQDGFRHAVACLEAPKNRQFVERILAVGGEVLLCPSRDELLQRIRLADIVQIEWWHHPIMAEFLGMDTLPPSRWVVWSHISGLHPPEIPPAFLLAPHRFLFTSPCSWEHPDLATLRATHGSHVAAVFSSGGFEELPLPPPRNYETPLRFGFVGTLNFAKLHPRFVDYIAAIRDNAFKLSMAGDTTGSGPLIDQLHAADLGRRVEFLGYQQNVANLLARFDVLIYLLNPLHYGTTENALLEAMAMGVVPIVMDNPAERYLVENGVTGRVVSDPASFADAVGNMTHDLDWLARMSAEAARQIRERFSIASTSRQLASHYLQLMNEEKRAVDFRPVFGGTPADWFLACQGAQAWRFTDTARTDTQDSPPDYLFEENKGSVFHYRTVFPDDPRLQDWAARLAAAKPR